MYKEYLERYYGELAQNNVYVVAYVSLHVGALKQRLIYAKTVLEALNSYLGSDYESEEELLEVVERSDSWISVLQINNTLTE